MIKFVLMLCSVFAMDAASPPNSIGDQIDEIKVEFSKVAIGIESGQPIFTKDTKIFVTNSTKDKIKLFINDEERAMNEEKMEISGLEEGTYTLLILAVDDENEQKAVGFTIQ